jgi:PAS domain S-box-containing protein
VREPGAPADPSDVPGPTGIPAASDVPAPPSDPIAASVRLERELSALATLANATGEARSKATLAQRALEAVIATTGADHGSIVMAQGSVGQMLAIKDVPAALEHIAGDVDWADSPGIRALTPIGRVVRGSIDRLPLDPVTRRELIAAGLRSLLLVGLHRDDELIGVLSLAWDRDDVPLPSDAMTQLMAITIARGLENARLVEDIVRRSESARESADRLRKIDELARVSGSVRSVGELADRSSRLINNALGAAATVYALLAADGVSHDPSSLKAVHAPIERWLRVHGPDLRSWFVRWRAGEGSHLGALEPGIVPAADLDGAREAGISAYAVVPIRVGDGVVGGVAAYFDRPPAELRFDRRDLDRVASIASMGLENVRLRERVAGADERFLALFAGSGSPMLLALPDGTLVDANDAALRLFGAEREWLLGRRPEEVAVYDFEQIASRLGQLQVGESFAGFAAGVRRDGRRFPVEVETTLVLLEGEPRLLARIHDLSDKERLEGELVAAQKMEVVGRLAPGIAHELGNPLAAILGFSQLIRRDPTLSKDLRQSAILLTSEAERTQRIAGNLLDFVAHRPPERRSTSLRALAESVLDLQAASLGGGTIDLEVDVPDDLPPVQLDRGQLQQVLINLTRNAIDAVRGGGGRRIAINAIREGRKGRDERVRITVTDDGPGVASEHVDRLFEAFFTTKPADMGTGLGLSVSRAIIRSHGGDLRYAPSPWGRGAAFTFDLPVLAAPLEGAGSYPFPARAAVGAAVTSTAASTEGRAAGGGRVLVLDDDATLRIYLEKALAALGYEPVIAASGAEAVELAATGDPGAVLCDHQMLGMSGIDVYEAIVADRPDLAQRFVMMSGDVLDPALEAFAATHEMTRLAKPFDLDTLERTLRSVMGRSAQPRG